LGVPLLSVGMLEVPSQTVSLVVGSTAPSDALPGNELRVTLRLNLSIVPAYSQLKLGGGNFSTGFLPRNVAYYAGYDTDHYGAALSNAAMFRIASGYGLFSTANVFR
jgi:hypothetical protein